MKKYILYSLILASLSFSSEVVILKAEKADYLKYEPIYLQTRYSGNASGVEFGMGHFNLKCQSNNDLKIKNYKSPIHLEPLKNANNIQSLNEVRYHEVSVDLNGWFISEPGNYKLWIETSKGTKSNYVSISINMPKEESDIEIFKDISAVPDFYKFAYCKGGLSFQKSVQLCKNHIKKPSKYQKHFKDFLVQTYSQIGFLDGEMKEPNLDEALGFYDKIGENENVDYGKIQTLHILKKCLKAKKKEAKKYGLDKEFKILDDREIAKGQFFQNL